MDEEEFDFTFISPGDLVRGGVNVEGGGEVGTDIAESGSVAGNDLGVNARDNMSGAEAVLDSDVIVIFDGSIVSDAHVPLGVSRASGGAGLNLQIRGVTGGHFCVAIGIVSVADDIDGQAGWIVTESFNMGSADSVWDAWIDGLF